jgi:hypothetical protein
MVISFSSESYPLSNSLERQMADQENVHKLSSSRLDRARRQSSQAEDALLALAELTLRELNSKYRAEDVVEIIVRPNNSKDIFIGPDGECLGVYEDPPGICRNCVDGS